MIAELQHMSEDDILETIRKYAEELEARQQERPQGKFNKKRYAELLKDPPTHFKSPFGTFTLRKELVKNLIISAKHLTQEFDLFMVFVGSEGAGKSLFVRQINFAMWWIMTELEMINYPFNLDLIHFGIKDLQQDRKDWDESGLKYRISILDESKDDIGRDKYKTPEANAFIDYIRRCRDESGVISLLLPQISELLPAIVLSRVVMIFEVDFDTDPLTGEIIRGDYKLVTIPRGKESYSLFHDKFLSKSAIKKILSTYLYKADEKYSALPNSVVSFQGTFKNVDPILTKEYHLKKRRKKWERYQGKDEGTSQKIEDIPIVRKSLDYLKILYTIHKEQGGKDKDIYESAGIVQRTFYRDKKMLQLSDI